MFTIILYLGLCALGYFIAHFLRSYRDKLKWTGTFQNVAVLLLIMTMGTKIGSYPELVKDLDKFGLYSLIFTLIVFLCSIFFCSIARRLLKLNKYGVAKNSEEEPEEKVSGEKSVQNQCTLVFVFFVVVAFLCGNFVIGNFFYDFKTLSDFLSNAITLELCVLLLLVGVDMGLSGEIMENFKKVGIKVLIIPTAIGLGTLVGAFISGLILPLSIRDSMAIGAGFGWYSLGAALMIDAGHISGGAISFLHNVMREIFSMLLIPIVVQKIGYVEALALPGAPAMDVCLPLISRCTLGTMTVYSFISGAVLSFAVPILVPIFL